MATLRLRKLLLTRSLAGQYRLLDAFEHRVERRAEVADLARAGARHARREIDGLADVDRTVLAELITECVAHVEVVERSMGAIPRMSDIPPRTPPDVVD